MIVYKITNKINGKVYIGQTIHSLSERWRKHCDKHSPCKALLGAIQKYGKENFTVEQIDVACDREELDKKEIYWINFYDSMNPEKGYNLHGGGKHYVVTEETRTKISNTLKGVKKSLETREKMSISQTGRKLSELTKDRIRNAFKGKPLSEEHKRKISESLKKSLKNKHKSVLIGDV